MCFDQAGAIPGLFTRFHRVPTWSNWWTLSPACRHRWGERERERERPDGWWKKLGSTFPLHLMAATRDTLHCLSFPLSVRLYHESKCEHVRYDFIGSTSSCYIHFFSLFTWRCSENSTEPALICLFPCCLVFVFFLTIHATFFFFGVKFLFCFFPRGNPDHTTCSAEMFPWQS